MEETILRHFMRQRPGESWPSRSLVTVTEDERARAFAHVADTFRHAVLGARCWEEISVFSDLDSSAVNGFVPGVGTLAQTTALVY
jgi:hypothetical protein